MGSIASTKKLSPIWDPVHLQTYSFLVWKPLKNKYFILVLFRNWPISTFPYVKLKEKWRKNGRLCAENCLNLFKNDLNSLLNKHWQGPRTLRILNCSAQYRCAYKTWILRQKLSLKLFYYRITKNWYKNQILDRYLHWTEQIWILKVFGQCQCLG